MKRQPTIHRPEDGNRLPREFSREIELVIREPGTGEILARTGLLVSSLESRDITSGGGHFESYFELAFVPAEGIEPPEGCNWSEQYGEWVRGRKRKGGAA